MLKVAIASGAVPAWGKARDKVKVKVKVAPKGSRAVVNPIRCKQRWASPAWSSSRVAAPVARARGVVRVRVPTVMVVRASVACRLLRLLQLSA
jgi:hypothetical protein